MATYELYDMDRNFLCTFTGEELKSLLWDDEKIDLRKISTGYLRPIKFNRQWVLIDRRSW